MQSWSIPLLDDEPASPNSPSSCGLGGSAHKSLWETSHAVSVWQRLTVFCLALISLVCLHYVLFSLHDILVPFFLSGFIVFALQPSVEVTYMLLAGISPPYRWFCCCCRRKATKRAPEEDPRLYGSCCIGGRHAGPCTIDEEAHLETEPLIEQVPTYAAMLGEAFCRFLAVSLAILLLVFIASLFIILLGHGAMHMKDNWVAYRLGLRRLHRLQDRMIDIASKELGMKAILDQKVKEAYDKMLNQAEDIVWLIVNEIISGLSGAASQLVIVLLYVMFWLMQPLPTGGKVSSVVRSYLWKKSFVSFLYGACVTLLFFFLSIDLAIFFGIVSFFLNFVPEVGAFISMIVPVPIILLDGRLRNPLLVLTTATTGQFLLKFLIGNILEVKLIERDREMNIHPVWIILGLSYFGFVWGPLGALLSVPMLAMVKTAALSVRGEMLDARSVIPALAESFLACFEGRHTCWARAGKANPPALEPRPERQPPAFPKHPPTPPASPATSPSKVSQ